MTKEKEDKVLSLADASAGFVGAAFLYFIQKLPDGSDAKQLLLYSMTFVALAANNVFVILFASGKRKWERRNLKSQHKDLSFEYDEYSKKENPDPEVMQEFNTAIKQTQLAILRNLTSGADSTMGQTGDLKKPSSKKRMNN
ncbi:MULTISPECIES: hypothetical protein [unclassified Pseudomonas]|uniref:hypothetical protein n=1 Tax=unclassified Pseudomonas TaxID=196821 RepID=UPI0024495DF6|nr:MULTISPECIES: hypothetical protein [unclassified Pseudomonas]MDG9926236.1 hypothetical protein [Pseudomonas sp. GD04045]MDH0037341.1 hypothetical protein [Pseudomonas sp. GD04019]